MYKVLLTSTWYREYKVQIMGVDTTVVLSCEMCGHRWLREGDGMPKQCPSRKCRSSKWDMSGQAGNLFGEGGGEAKVGRHSSVVERSLRRRKGGSSVRIPGVAPSDKVEVARAEVAKLGITPERREPTEKHPEKCRCQGCTFRLKYGKGGGK